MHEEKGWIGEGGVDHQTRVTTWEHYEEVRKINKFISNLNQEGTWEIKLSDFNVVFCSFFFWNTIAGNSLGWHHVKSESIHDERRWWERKYEIIRWIPQGRIHQLAGMVEYVRVPLGGVTRLKKVKMLKITSPTHRVPCLAGLGPWILVKYIISCLFQIHNGPDRFYLVS